MIPSNSGLLNTEITTETQPSKNHAMKFDKKIINGMCDRQPAMVQVVDKILNTERYDYIIYSWNYGVELADLINKPINYVCAEIPHRIKEALLQDDRILSVEDFSFDTSKKGSVVASFTVHTVFGDFNTQKVVNV